MLAKIPQGYSWKSNNTLDLSSDYKVTGYPVDLHGFPQCLQTNVNIVHLKMEAVSSCNTRTHQAVETGTPQNMTCILNTAMSGMQNKCQRTFREMDARWIITDTLTGFIWTKRESKLELCDAQVWRLTGFSITYRKENTVRRFTSMPLYAFMCDAQSQEIHQYHHHNLPSECYAGLRTGRSGF
jgi:hypothetical protein